MMYILALIAMFFVWLVAMIVDGYLAYRRQWFASAKGSRGPPSLWQYIVLQWRVTVFKATRKERAQLGAMDVGGIMLMGIGMVFLAVGFIIFPIVTTATDALLAYAYSANNTITDASFTGFTAVIGITPLLVLIGYLSAAVFSMFLGVKIIRGQGDTSLNLGNLLMLGISQIFIAIALIILPVALDGISSVLHGSGSGINAAYVGLSPILLVTPLLILISFLAGAVITGFFGIKKISGD